jgi:uncharacterized protein (TIGR02246 family)
MKLLTTCFAMAAVVLSTTARAAGGDKLMQQVTAFDAAMEQAMLADDLDAWLGFYLDDAISLPEYSPMLVGKDAIRRHYEEMATSGVEVTSMKAVPTRVWKAGDQVIEIGTYEMVLSAPGMPDPITDKGKYVTIYQRQKGGKLKVKVDAWSTDLNPMLMGAVSGHAVPE